MTYYLSSFLRESTSDKTWPYVRVDPSVPNISEIYQKKYLNIEIFDPNTISEALFQGNIILIMKCHNILVYICGRTSVPDISEVYQKEALNPEIFDLLSVKKV